MKFLLYLMKKGRALVIVSALLGIASGSANAALISMISNKISDFQADRPHGFLVFVLVLLAALLGGILSQILLIHLSQKFKFHLRINLCEQILDLPLLRIEQTGKARLVATFTEDIPAITSALMEVPALFINVAITTGCLVYLGYLSPLAFSFLLVFLLFSAITYSLPEKIAVRYVQRAREAMDAMFAQFTAMMSGTKELKLHYLRRKTFFHDVLYKSTEEVRKTGYLHRLIYVILNSWIHMLYFFFIGLLLFIMPVYLTLDLKTITGFALIALYISGPIGILLNAAPLFRKAEVAFAKLKSMGLVLMADNKLAPFEEDEPFLKQIGALDPLQRIELKGVTHTFYREAEETYFSLGPVDLTIHRGELIFLIGGNGSGKTTLAKLLTGLFLPESGEIHLNGTPVSEDGWEYYRQYFSAIFNDFFVFEQFLGLDQKIVEERALMYLKKFHLDHKVSIKDGKLSTTKLSTGQRKRLALFTAYLEDRQIYLFDEWAADQDPEFKNVFYRLLLPELKARGKTVIVISHDDRYFDLADRIVKLTEGKLDAILKPSALET